MTPEDDDTFREFVRTRAGEMMRRAYVLTGGHQSAAEDLVQIALAKAARQWRGLANPMAFVRTVMYRQQVSWHRLGWSRHEAATAAPPERGTPGGVDQVDLRLTVRAALFRLTPRQRLVLFLRHYEDLPDTEVAEVLGCSVGTVRSTNHRALQRLRKVAPELAELYGDINHRDIGTRSSEVTA